MWIVATAVMVASSFAFSPLAQSQPPSAECISAYNDTFDSHLDDCSEAYFAVFSGNATADEQRMMVCDAGQRCNTMIENIISLCGDTIDSPTRFFQDLICTIGPSGDNCLTSFVNLSTSNDRSIIVFTSCNESCSENCMQSFVTLNNTLGCCFAELVRALVNSGMLESAQASLVTNTYPQQCGLGIFTLCDGNPLPADECGTASIALFGSDDECSMSVWELLFNDNSTDSVILNLYNGDCPTRFLAYAIACSESFGDSADEILQLANSVVAISQARDSNGRHCTELLPMFLNGDVDELNCIEAFLLNQCPNSCEKVLINVTMEYGCCLNTIISEFYGRSNEIDEQIEYAITTRDIYRTCGIPSGGFCAETNPAPYSSAANKCISARNSFISDSTCLDYYLALGQRSSAIAVNNAAIAICASQQCKNRMSSYINVLITCRVENIINDDDDDDNDDDEEDTSYLELAYLTGNTTCRVDRTNTSCFSSIYFNQQYALDSAAFDFDDVTAVCVSTFTGQTCSAECVELIIAASQNFGCCLGEFFRALLGDDIWTSVLNRCGVTSLGQRCAEPQTIQDASVERGSNTQTGYLIVVILVLGVILSVSFLIIAARSDS